MEEDNHKTFYVTIGNSDDKLSQVRWAEFCAEVGTLIHSYARVIHGEWKSYSASRWQNACWCFELAQEMVTDMRLTLAAYAARYDQESILWAQAQPEFIKAVPMEPQEVPLP